MGEKDLRQHYRTLYRQAVAQFRAGVVEIDPLIDAAEDRRYGITLLLRPDPPAREKISAFLDKARSIEPNQYFYPPGDLHVTVLSIISCYTGFRLEDIDPDAYRAVIAEALAACPPFEIRLQGVTASPAGILIQGFPEGPGLGNIRDRLREAFGASALQQSIDKRYVLRTAHLTVIRFRERCANEAAFLDLLEVSRETDFGVLRVTALDLVANDWYQRSARVKLLERFSLQATPG